MKTDVKYIEVGNSQHILLLSNLRESGARGNVLIVPPFGKSAKDMFIFAAYLWNAGWNVFRFDARNHVGASSGEIEHFTLSSLLADLNTVAGWLEGRQPGRLILLGVSLSVPVLVKFAARNPSVLSSISVVGAFDVVFAMEQAGGDVVAQYREDWPNQKLHQTILGYKVLAKPFVTDMDEIGFAPLEALVDDARAVAAPLHLVTAEEDAWVTPESTAAIYAAAPTGSTLTRFEGLTHEFGRSIRMAKLICLEVRRLCNIAVGADEDAYPVPSFAEILRTSSAEASDLDLLTRAGHERATALGSALS